LALFGAGSLDHLDEATLEAALREAPFVEITAVDRLPTYVDLLAETGLAASKGAARRTVAEGGAYANNVRITDIEQRPGRADLLPGGWLLLRRGKRNLAGVKVG
jgi:tyrosyl-tRNA synthetase